MNTLFPMTQILDAALNGTLANQDMDNLTWGRSPRADVLEGEKEYRIIMDLPGVKTEDLDISLEDHSLSVKATREIEVPEGFQLARNERPTKTEYHRTFNLGSGVDSEGIKASFQNGVLELVAPKSKQSLPRRIEIQ